MRIGRALLCTAMIMGLGLASCSPARQGMIRNASGGDVLLWPLGERPETLKAGETTGPLLYWAHQRQQALLERGNCLYTYPAPDYSGLPKAIRNYKPFTVVIRPDMTLGLHQRSKDGVEGPEITVAGFPLRPTTFCGRRGEG